MLPRALTGGAAPTLSLQRPRRRHAAARATLLAAACGAALAPASAADAKAKKLPRDFVGIATEDVFTGTADYAATQLKAQRRAGVGIARQEFRWALIERQPGVYDFTMTDAFVARAATAGIRVMPLLKGEPAWATSRPAGNTIRAEFPPADMATYARFAKVIALRYGRGGSFWTEHPTTPYRPITRYQIWNEPNLPAYWGGKPNAKAYARMVKAAALEIRSVDPKAYLVSAGIPDSRLGQKATWYIKRLLRAGAGKYLSAIAIHPYEAKAKDVIKTTRKMRRAVSSVGKNRRRDLWITEIGWAAGGPWTAKRSVTATAQGRRIVTTYRALAKRRKSLRLRGIVYYAWRDSEVYPGGREFWGLYTGLVDRSGEAKPGLTTVTKGLRRLQRRGR